MKLINKNKLHKKAHIGWLGFIKLFWLLGVIIALVFFAKRIPELIDFTELRYWPLFLGAIFIMLSHCCVSGIREITTRNKDRPLSYLDNAVIFSASNLSKYLPIPAFNIAVMGWMLRRAGLSNIGVGRSILLGVYWTTSSALLLGLPSVSNLLPTVVSKLCWSGPIIWVMFLFSRPEKYIGIHIPYAPLKLAVLQIGLWLGYAMAFILTVYAARSSIEVANEFLLFDWFQVGLSYVVSYGVGLLAIFAPAGAGIRETILALSLADLALIEIWIALAILVRVVIFLGDVLFSIIIYAASQTKLRAR